MVPAFVERDFSFMLDGDRVRGRYDRVDIIPAGSDAVLRPAEARDPKGGADVVEPTLFEAAERVVITDYKSSDVRDPAKAKERAKNSLQLTIYAMAYEAMTGRLPDTVALHFLDSGLVGSAPVDAKRIEKAREQIRTAAAGMRARNYAATPDYMACSHCAFREICPSSAVSR